MTTNDMVLALDIRELVDKLNVLTQQAAQAGMVTEYSLMSVKTPGTSPNRDHLTVRVMKVL